MTALYVPPTDESDHKKQNQSLQLIGGVVSANTVSIATNTTGIATLNASRASSSTFGLAEVDNTSMTAALGVLSTGRAAKSDQTTATSTTLAVTPSIQQNHPSAAKAWVKFTGSASNGNQTIGDSFNVTTVARTSAGNYTVTFTTAFTTANYGCLGSSHQAGTINGFVQFGSLLAGSINAQFINISGPATFDPTLGASLVFFGTQ